MTRTTLLAMAGVAGLVGALRLSPQGGAASARPSGSPAERSCFIAGVSRPVRCVTVTVPLNWSEPAGEVIEVSAVVVPAIGPALPDPLFVLPGGPGQGASVYGRLVGTAFAEIRKGRDIVLMDPRGTGMSSPFPCTLGGELEVFAEPVDMARLGKECAASAPADPRFFTADQIVEDIDALRSALGYQSINVWGGSFGTRLAQYYLKVHQTSVRAVIFDAAVPVGKSLLRTAPIDAQAALDELFARCEGTPECSARFGTGQAGLEGVVRSFAVPRSLMTPNSRSGVPEPRPLDRRMVAEVVRGALYTPSMAVQLPFAIERLGEGDPGPAAALQLETAGWSTSTQQMGAMLAVMCNEEAAPVRAGGTVSQAGETLFADDYAQVFLDLCADWPLRPLPSEFTRPLSGNPVPALVLSGAMDPVSPPGRGGELAKAFLSAKHLIVRNGGHTNSARGCAPRLLAAFIDAPGAELDGSCLDDIAWPPFTLSAQGPVSFP